MYHLKQQKHFLSMRAKQRIEGTSGKESYVKDRSLSEDLLIFCRQFHSDGHLSSDELDLLTTEFKKVSNRLPEPDLMIVLQGRPQLAWSRIQQRGREMEMNGGWSYSEIASMTEFYRTYAQDVRKFGFHSRPILEIDVNKIDLSNRIHLGYLFELIYEALTQEQRTVKQAIEEQELVTCD